MKTAVEWLEEMFNNSEIPNSSMLFKQAKEMEKEQIIEARFTAPIIKFTGIKAYLKEAKQYYNETFKSE
jgi:predicted 3-demethylubiquinone-9 3-methyltransferase (glyoxalase superfamily)